jgi:SAM-dependent methyltransferase
MGEKKVLDACCGSRMFWFDKKDYRVLFCDNRQGKRDADLGTPSTKGRSPVVVAPDLVQDFREMVLQDNTFHHVIFDPPHLTAKTIGSGKTGIFPFKYGVLNKETWEDDIKKGFSECFRVLRPNGTLIFKWASTEIPLKKVLSLTDQKPLYGHHSGKKAHTHWVAFIKENQPDSTQQNNQK